MPVTQLDLISETRNVLPAAKGGAGGGVNPQTGTSYTVVQGDNRKLVYFDNASAVAVAIDPSANLGSTFFCWLENLGAGTATLTPDGSETIDGAASLTLDQNQGVMLFSDGSNLFTSRGRGSGGGGGSPSASTATITTASLATSASESGSATIFKSFALLKVNFSCKARVRLYSTSAARDSDASRPWGTIPTLYAQNELIADVQMSSGSGDWIMSPAAVGFNMDTTRSTSIYYRVTNLDTAQTVTITLTALQMES